jgi:hypothetical protein
MTGAAAMTATPWSYFRNGCAGLGGKMTNFMTPDLIRKIVFSNLESAKEGGYFEEYLGAATPEEIADDLVALAEDLERYLPKDILPYVKEWLER